MKNFDVARQERRTGGEEFQIGGEVFRVWLGAHPDEIAQFENMDPELALSGVLEHVDEAVLAMISPENEGHERYRALRVRREDPISVPDLLDLAQWLVGEQAGRPTESPSGSSSGPAIPATGTTLTAVSSSEDSPEVATA